MDLDNEDCEPDFGERDEQQFSADRTTSALVVREGSNAVPPAFKHCKSRTRTAGSNWQVSCGLSGCSITRTTTSTKWGYGHVLRQIGYDVRPCKVSLREYRLLDPE